jgi:hypothetical protein
MKKLFLLWGSSVLVSLVLNGQVYGMEDSVVSESEIEDPVMFESKSKSKDKGNILADFSFLKKCPNKYEEELKKLLGEIELFVEIETKKLKKLGKSEEEIELFVAQIFMKEVDSKGSAELEKFIQENLPKDSLFRKKSFWQSHGDKVILGTAIVSAAIIGYWSSELEALIVKHKKIVIISLALLLFGGVGCYCLKNCKDGGLWKSIKKDAESLKNVTKILTLVLPPATYLIFRNIFKKKKLTTIEI